MVGLEVPWEPIEALYLEQEGVMPDLPLLASREPVPVYDLGSGRHIGRATTRAWSMLLKKYIALATVEAQWAAPGTGRPRDDGALRAARRRPSGAHPVLPARPRPFLKSARGSRASARRSWREPFAMAARR